MKIEHNMPACDYHASPGLSNSALKWFKRSPAHYKAFRDGKILPEPTKAQSLGTLVHSFVLEGVADFVVPPDTYPSKDGDKPWNRNATYCKEWEAGQADPVVPRDVADSLYAAANAIRSDKFISGLLTGGQPEVSLFAECSRTGLPLKARVDYLAPGHMVDLKTTKSAATPDFVRAIASYKYASQAAFYKYVAELCGMEINDFYFIALELEPFPMANVFLVSQQDLEIATAELKRALTTLLDRQVENHWPGYCDGEAHVITLPSWAHGYIEETLDLNA